MYRKWLITAVALCGLWMNILSVSAETAAGISSKSAVLLEATSGRVLYEKEAHIPRAIASTTKIMTALLALENRAPHEEITVTSEAVRVEGSSLGLRAGDQISMLDLVTGLLLVSGNDAANAIALSLSGSLPAFAEKMNQKAAALGMKNTLFVTPSGLDAENHSASAYDMALLGAAAMKNAALAEIFHLKNATVSFGNPKRKVMLSNHNRLLSLYPYAVGMKTGFTKKSGRCLVSAARKDGVLLIAVTLGGGNDWNDHMQLYTKGFEQVEQVTLAPPVLPPLPVGGGKTGMVNLQTAIPPAFVLLKGEREQIKTRVDCPPFIFAPVQEREQVGEIHYSLEGKTLAVVPIQTAEGTDARPVKSYGERVKNWLQSLLAAFLG